MRALITGSGGFVGGYLRRELEEHGYEVLGLDVRPQAGTIQADLLDPEQMARAIRAARPDAVFHLAGQADVARSWREPRETMEVNVIGAVDLMEAVRAFDPSVRMVLVGSSDQYGELGDAGRRVEEAREPRPRTPYAVSKQAQEELAQLYVRAHGMDLRMTRSFNHAGPGQREGFLIADFAAGIARVEQGLAPCLKVGDLEARRDFTHVRDVVRAYRLICEQGRPGEVYNVGSGRAHSVREILDRLLAMASCPVPVVQDPARLRPSDTRVICCDHSKLTLHTGWAPQIPLDAILSDVLREWRENVQKGLEVCCKN